MYITVTDCKSLAQKTCPFLYINNNGLAVYKYSIKRFNTKVKITVMGIPFVGL